MSDASGARLIAALLASGAVSLDDLAQGRQHPPTPAPTHRDYLAVVLERCPPRSLTTYRTNFRRIAAAFEDTTVTDVVTTDLARIARRVRNDASGHRGAGVGAERGFIHAARFWGRCVTDDGYRQDNPAAALVMPSRPSRVRRALSEVELRDLYRAVLESSTDPELDLLLLDFHRETAAPRAARNAPPKTSTIP